MVSEMARKERKRKDVWRAKTWYDIVAPPMFGSAKIGETVASEPEQLSNRTLETTLGDLIDDFSKSHVKLFFRTKGLKDGRVLTEFIGHDMAREYVRSQVRRRVTKVDCITDVVTRDGKRLRVTAMATSLRRVKSSHIDSIRSGMRGAIERRAEKLTFDAFAQEVVLGKLAADIYKEIKRICPIRRVEVQKTKVLKEAT